MPDVQSGGMSVRSLYDALADVYDEVTRSQDYDRWVRLYLDLIGRHGAPGKRLLDVGAGTGRGTIRLARAGYDVTAIDLSSEMVNRAAANSESEGIRFVVADVRDMPELGTFDVAVTLGEPFIYLTGEQELFAALRGIAGALAPDGLVIFDLGTAGFYQRLKTRVTVEDGDGELTLIRGASSEYDSRGAAYLLDRFSSDDGVTWRRFSQRHLFSYFAPDAVDRLLREAGLVPVARHGLYAGELQDEADDMAHRKVFVVARKLDGRGARALPAPPRGAGS